jgi:glutamyl-tRNA(Gln) amidotransferase subunit E
MENESDAKLTRRLHPVYSELGEVDVASKREFERERTFEYLAYKECNCLVEADEEPPHFMNPDALGIALEIAMHLNCKPVDEIHIMRKIIIDGSNTSGFQRTAIIAMNGELKTAKGLVRIPQISIEEESAGIVESKDNSQSKQNTSTFRLDRLGIPLIEITTDPDIKDKEHLHEVAEKIGMIMRATGKVARGLGTIRQDLNVSIEGGARVEIKGAQELKMLPVLAELEENRQRGLLAIISELTKKFKGKLYFEKEITDVTEVFSETQSKMIRAGLDSGAKVFGIRLPHHSGFLGKELQPNKRYGTELSDYAKSAGVKGIIHSDEEMGKYSISSSDLSKLWEKLKMKEDDAFALVVAEEKTAIKALENVWARATTDFIPNETRRANPDGTTSYMRPMPGRARLYPETDVPPIRVTDELISSVESGKSDSLDEKRKKLQKMLNSEMAEVMIKSRNLPLFEKLTARFKKTEPMLIASTLENTLVSLRRDGFELKNHAPVLEELFSEYEQGMFVKAAISEILKLVTKGASVQSAVKEGKLQRITGKELQKIAKENGNDLQKIMQKYRLNVDPSELSKSKK